MMRRTIPGVILGVGLLFLAFLPSWSWAQDLDPAALDRVARFRNEVRALAADLHRVAPHEDTTRIRLIAYTVVSEAYRYDVPVPLVFGVLLQETWQLDGRAVSVAGARGLMQVMPRYWLRSLGPYFGYDLFDDVTNIRYGIWILAHYASMSNGDWRETLNRYSGGAKRYVERVRTHIETKGRNVCPQRDIRICVDLPLRRTFSRSFRNPS